MAQQRTVDMENRDPNDLNSHIKVTFEDVLAEPEGVRSIDCIWRNAFACFECGKNLCYKLLTTLCGLCIALFWGCDFAMTAFDQIWCMTPCMRDFSICIGFCQRVNGSLINCCLAPICEACGFFLKNITITKK